MKYLILFLTILSFSCKSKYEINKITYKFSGIKSNGRFCQECVANSKECCEIFYHGKKFIKNYHFKFKENGIIDTIYSYHVPLGVSEYSLNEYVDGWKPEKDSLLNYKVRWNKSKSEIIDNNKIIKNFKIDLNNKYIYILKGKTIDIYQFE